MPNIFDRYAPAPHTRNPTATLVNVKWTPSLERSTMKSFQNDIQLLKKAEKFLDWNISSLEANVNHCLAPGKDINHGLISLNAPFPALLFCFSIIDLLASLYCGDARGSGNTTKYREMYMKDMMKYDEDQCHLLQKIIRHKLVHLGSPRTVYTYKKKNINITWYHVHDDPGRERHLQLKFVSSKGYIQPEFTIIKHNATHYFWIGIKQLVEDIKQSVQGPKGYLSKLKTDPTLRKKFDKAIFEIYSPT